MKIEDISAYLPANWLSLQLDVENVWNTFFTYALLLDHAERRATLNLAHQSESHTKHLLPALQVAKLAPQIEFAPHPGIGN